MSRIPPSPDLPPVLLQWQLASHLRRVPHPEELGDDGSPLRGSVSGRRDPSFLSWKSRLPPKTFPRRNFGCPNPESNSPLRSLLVLH